MAERADIAITAGGSVLGLLRSAVVQTQVQTVEAASEDVYGWRRREAVGMTWSASGEVFVRGPSLSSVGHEEVRDGIMERQLVAVLIEYEDGSQETGEALVSSWTESGEIGGAAEGVFQLVGSGPLSEVI